MTELLWFGLGTNSLVFVIVHLQQFKFGAWYEIGNPPIRDLYRVEAEVFTSALWVGVYVVCAVLVGFHLRHGISSAFQSLGADHPVYTRRLVAAGTILAILIAGGFAVIPVWVYFTQ